MRVAYFGTWEPGYPRNEQVISCLRRAGVEVDEIRASVWRSEQKFALGPSVLPRVGLAELRLALRRVSRAVDALIVGYPGHFDLASAKVHRRPVIFNPMVSLYETFVEDRQRFGEASFAARSLRAIDRVSFRAADLLVSDTATNAAAMADLAGIERVTACFLGAEERLFRPGWSWPREFTALFVGKPAPLHGLPTILKAASLLPDAKFRIVGSGQLDGLLLHRPPNVEHVQWVDYEHVPEEFARAGCALGIFGTSAKAGRVIPHKVFQALACGTPVITADTPAARELLTDGSDALLVQANDPQALAAAVDRLRNDEALARRISAAGLTTFRQRASEEQLGKQWRSLVEQLVAAA
jgi:glycosyltransferase involved in cell wall biosynthesis